MHSIRKSLAALASIAILMGLTSVVRAATLFVPGVYPTIQFAIVFANPGDTIMVSPGVYFESLDWESKDLTIQGAGQGQTTVIAQGGSCISTSNLSSASSISGFTFEGGNSSQGGGMYNNQSYLTVSNCTFTNNVSNGNYPDGGAGMYNDAGGPTITHCTFSNNQTNVSGGGIYNTDGSTPTVSNCTFSNNQAVFGGGMYNDNSLLVTVTNCTFTGNQAHGGDGYGGGIENAGGDVLVSGCTFSNNRAGWVGGGMDNSGTAEITNCVFTGNVSDEWGGGVSQEGAGAVTNCTFSNNLGVFGSGMYCYLTNSPVINCTFSGQSLFVDGSCNITLTNCIVWGNGSGIGPQYVGGTWTLSHSDVQGLSNSTPDANGNFAANPLFVRNPGTNSPSDLGDLHLQPGSPCINVGNNTVVTSPPFLMDPTNMFIIDLDGNHRIVAGTVDLGAYESQNQPPVANAGPSQTIAATHSGNPANDTAAVTLDGSGSSDPNGDTLTYAWNDGQGHTSTAVQPTFNLPAGTYTFTLTVTDTVFLSSSATVTVTVNPAPNQAPIANAGANQTLTASLPANTASVTLNGSASSDPDNDALTFVWTDQDNVIVGNSATVNLNLPVGSYTFTLTVTDPYGATASSTIHVTVNAAAQAPKVTLALSSIVDLQPIFGVVVTLTNGTGAPITNATITSASLIGVNFEYVTPRTGFTLGAGQSRIIGLVFTPLSKGQQGTLSIQGSYTGGTFSLSQTVTIP